MMIAAFLAGLAVATPANGAGKAESFCATLTEGATRFVVDTDVRVMEQTALPVPFQLKTTGPKVLAIECRRQDPLPVAMDYKVVAAGYPLFIQSYESVTVLEGQDGQFAFRVLRGRLTSQQQAQLKVRLENVRRAARGEEALAMPAPAKPGPK